MRNVSLVLGDGDTQVTALDAVELTVQRGELLAVVGPSGSGKSSLLAVAGALVRPTSGPSRWTASRSVDGLVDAAMARVRRDQVGFVFQQANLLPSLIARDQLLFVAHVRGRVTSAHRRRADELLARSAWPARDRRPHQLSGGERQRVGIARALDERPRGAPARRADLGPRPRARRRGRDLLARQTHERGTATVMVTHDLGIAPQADRTVTMRDGRLLASAEV